MQTILFITDLHIGAQITKIAGVFAQARRRGWRVIEIERDRTMRPVADFVESLKPIGCIYECSGLGENPSDTPSGIPTVLLDPAPSSRKPPRFAVASDAGAIAAMAAAELESAGCESFAFAGWRNRTGWSVERGEAFRDALLAKGHDCALLDTPWSEELEVQKVLAAELSRMGRRIGVFSANDYVAKQVMAAIEMAGMECPRDCAVVGVDDDELICETYIPTISSISIDFSMAGHLAVDLLAEIIAHPNTKSRVRLFGPTALRRRQSTRLINSNDWRIVKAVERIRTDACSGLKANDVIAATGLSRRLVERRFLQATGRTILAEITEVRFNQACQLLRDPAIPIGEIAALCGWESDSYLKRVFKARTGKTPRQWRRDALYD